ncbi:MAG: branched-chain-amino-acid transaminase [Phycisphaeraceae bacterium]|nr:branched-chain-amino-acid transaminase [Phycisphaeraceae bacterium]
MTTVSTRPATGASAVPSTDRPLIWVNGELKPKSQAMVNVYDHGLLYGDGIFEGIRVYQGRIFLCKQHIERLWKCASDIRMTIPVSKDEMVSIMRKCIEANGLVDGYIRLIVTRGVGTLGLDPRRCPVPGIICIADQISLFPSQMYDEGMRVVVANRPKTPVECLDPRIKSLNYLNNILAKCEAIDYDCHEVIMLNLNGDVTEGSGDNIFIIKNGEIFTPPSGVGLLEGITRRFVMERLAPDCGMKVVEKSFKLDELLKADEIFLTGSAAEIISVTQVDQHDGKAITKTTRISQGEGPITNRLRQRFRQIVTSPDVPEN